MPTIFYYIAALLAGGLIFGAGAAVIENRGAMIPEPFSKTFWRNIRQYVGATALASALLIGCCLLEAACL